MFESGQEGQQIPPRACSRVEEYPSKHATKTRFDIRQAAQFAVFEQQYALIHKEEQSALSNFQDVANHETLADINVQYTTASVLSTNFRGRADEAELVQMIVDY